MKPARDWPTDGTAPPLKIPKVTLIAHDPNGDGLVFAIGVGDKRRLLATTRGPLWAAWRGTYHTDLFVLDRRDAAREIAEGKDVAREVDDILRALIEWWTREARRHRHATVYSSLSSPNVIAAKRILAAEKDRATIKAIGQYALSNHYWRGKVLTVAGWWRNWDRIRADWERDDEPAYEGP